MKIAVIGYSGSGKSTLARTLAEHYGIPVLHLDTVQFLPGWVARPAGEKERITREFLDANAAWVVDGNYSALSFERRMEEADRIILLLFGRLACFSRVLRRYRTYRNTSRPDMTEGCPEKVDLAFAGWVLYGGRKKAARERYRKVREHYADKAVTIRNQRQLTAFLRTLDGEGEVSGKY